MRILIVDDKPKRYDRLMAALNGLGISRADIEMANCANEARQKIEAERFDLMLLDIMLPLWPENDEDVQNAIDLLFELHEGGTPNRPRRILGITADRAVAGQALSQFEDWTWTVLDYADDNDEWVNRAVNCAKYLLDQLDPQAPSGEQVDLAIICALQNPELDEVLRLPWNWSAPRPIDDVTFVYDGFVEVMDRRITICATTATRMGMVSTALRSASIISHFKPRLMVMTGICAGVRGKVNMGDVLFADPAWDFQSGKRVKDTENTQFSIRPHQLTPATKVRAHIEQIRNDVAGLATMSQGMPDGPGTTKLRIGPVASGSAVLADGEVIKEIRHQHQELIGVEMEIYGLYAAAHSAPAPQPLFFALKGVCDFADPDKEDGKQRYAAYASARVLQMLIERYGPQLLD